MIRPYDAQKYHRRSIRLKGYDYSQAGAYFITACTQDRECLFGEVVDGRMRLNAAGCMIAAEWETLPQRFAGVDLDAFVVMPNHVHGIIVITDPDPDPNPVGAGLVPAPGLVPALNGATTRVAPTDRATTRVAPTDRATTRVAPTDRATTRVAPTDRATTRVAPTVGDVVGAFKSCTTFAYTQGVKQSGWLPFRGKLWQRNYYEHIIRSESSLAAIREYIVNNPLQWALDRENPARAIAHQGG